MDRSISCVADCSRYHEVMYIEKGKKATERVWLETMEEFEFAKAKEVVASMA